MKNKNHTTTNNQQKITPTKGDSGAPLFTEVQGEAVIVGLVSWAVGCGKPLRPGVYTRVSAYRDWINSKIAKYEKSLTAPKIDIKDQSSSGPQDSFSYSCEGHCGLQVEDCYCDLLCIDSGDCCKDFESICFVWSNPVTSNAAVQQTAFKPGSCLMSCGMRSNVENGCWCDVNCVFRNDCCQDYQYLCSQLSPAPQSLASPSSPSSPLPSFAAAAPQPSLVSAGSCLGSCGKSSLLYDGSECFCDTSCVEQADCCPDYNLVCAQDGVDGGVGVESPAAPSEDYYYNYGSDANLLLAPSPSAPLPPSPLPVSPYIFPGPQTAVPTTSPYYPANFSPPSPLPSFEPIAQQPKPLPQQPLPQQQPLPLLQQPTNEDPKVPMPAPTATTVTIPSTQTPPTAPSCFGKCAVGISFIGVNLCYCDQNCRWHGDCCLDREAVCK